MNLGLAPLDSCCMPTFSSQTLFTHTTQISKDKGVKVKWKVPLLKWKCFKKALGIMCWHLTSWPHHCKYRKHVLYSCCKVLPLTSVQFWEICLHPVCIQVVWFTLTGLCFIFRLLVFTGYCLLWPASSFHSLVVWNVCSPHLPQPFRLALQILSY